MVVNDLRPTPLHFCLLAVESDVAVILLPAHPASFAHKFLFQRVPGCNNIADLSSKIVALNSGRYDGFLFYVII